MFGEWSFSGQPLGLGGRYADAGPTNDQMVGYRSMFSMWLNDRLLAVTVYTGTRLTHLVDLWCG
jgi:hypothetical protein